MHHDREKKSHNIVLLPSIFKDITKSKASDGVFPSYILFQAASILAAWLGGFTFVYTPGVVQNSYKEKKNKQINCHMLKWKPVILLPSSLIESLGMGPVFFLIYINIYLSLNSPEYAESC